jgi:phosphoserine phosphatase
VLAEKVRRIRERFDLAAFDHVYAYGDTVEDEPMLALAQERYFRTMPEIGHAAGLRSIA